MPIVSELYPFIIPSAALQGYANKIKTRNYSEVGFPLTGALKDLKLALEVAEEAKSPLPFGNIVRDKLVVALNYFQNDKYDCPVWHEVTRNMAGFSMSKL